MTPTKVRAVRGPLFVAAGLVAANQALWAAELRAPAAERRGQSIWLALCDAALLRSFSALELQDPVLDGAGYRRLPDDALAYLHDERDLRGIDPRVGWIRVSGSRRYRKPRLWMQSRMPATCCAACTCCSRCSSLTRRRASLPHARRRWPRCSRSVAEKDR
jgi:hypothetical protein